MSSTRHSSRHHIPFPRAFLAVNVPIQKYNDAGLSTSASAAAPVGAASPQVTAHPFLSNSPTTGFARHGSMSSVSSDDVDPLAAVEASAPGSPDLAAASNAGEALPAFLALNQKYAATPAAAPALTGERRHSFLTNIAY